MPRLPDLLSPPATPWVTRVLLLLLPPLLALAVWFDGQHYDPGLLEFQKGSHVTSEMAHMFPDSLGPLKKMGSVREYTRENLYEYINGHADFFIGAGFRHLTVGEYGPSGARQPSLVVDLYDMGKPMFAFGVLMEQKSSQSQTVHVGEMAFVADRTLSLIKGPYYVRLAAFSDEGSLQETAALLAGKIVPKTGEESDLSFSFPDFGNVGDTRFIKENYRGMNFLNHVVERSFSGEKGESRTAFLIVGTPEETAALEKALLSFLQGEEIPYRLEPQGDAKIVRISDRYEGDWVLAIGRQRLLGVFGPLRPQHMQRLAEYARQ
ncbi:MAG: hypothetical protein HQL63_06700 [Magnetococcales bacterium]|nr:hypothetical protein [Magnetococcales bacterium]